MDRVLEIFTNSISLEGADFSAPIVRDNGSSFYIEGAKIDDIRDRIMKVKYIRESITKVGTSYIELVRREYVDQWSYYRIRVEEKIIGLEITISKLGDDNVVDGETFIA